MSVFGRPLLAYVPAFVLLVATAIYVATAARYPADARALPMLIGLIMLILLPLDLIAISETPLGRSLRRVLNPSTRTAEEEAEEAATKRRQFMALGCVAAFALALVLIGVAAAIPLYVGASMWLFGRRPMVSSLVWAAAVGVFAWLLFEMALGVDLYPGLLFGGAA
jgi:hypothetical protein